jgi:hypothetical protein
MLVLILIQKGLKKMIMILVMMRCQMKKIVSNMQGSNKKKQKNKAQQKKNIPNLITNIDELAYLLPNTTAHLQPIDAGIINSFKSKYKQEFCKHLIQQFDSGIDYRK